MQYFPLVVMFLCHQVMCKVFQRCELVRELSKKKHRIPPTDIATWVCIARHESEFNTSAVGHLNADRSGDHGLFQISDLYWCSPPGVGQACGLNCDALEDDDITDDIICARRIYRATKRRTGDGFSAWAVYGPHCRGDNSIYIKECDNILSITVKPLTSTETLRKTYATPKVEVTTESLKHKPTMSMLTKKPFLTGTLSSDPNVFVANDLSSTNDKQDKTVSSLTTDSHVSSDRIIFASGPSTFSYDFDLLTKEPVFRSGARQPYPRRSQTSSPWNNRPTFSSANQSPLTAWLNVHYHPKFLDELP